MNKCNTTRHQYSQYPWGYCVFCLLVLLALQGAKSYGQTVNNFVVEAGNTAWFGSQNTTTALTASNVTVEAHAQATMVKSANINMSNITTEPNSHLMAASSSKIRITGSFRVKAGATANIFVDPSYFSCSIGNRTATVTVDAPVAELTAASELTGGRSVYPNPFTNEVTIAFEAGQAQPVQFVLFDLLGNQLASETYHGPATNGKGSILFSGAGLTPGIYLYQLRAGNQVKTGKLMKK